ncbi:capsid protein [Pseudoalteromonas sp. McH1-7]|uniref:capsid protein n=1 Tax=Pseudoalteromonas sp. McH1-7 TaxID=2745574 RepID=UPI0015927656|nr:capsid protein [Pseudoalteromonas sp. McH1-7]NUZ10162.1 capsid protein [Pseudoalteromonas sp. McH1-7]
MSNGMPFTPDTHQTAIAIAYHNRALIANTLMPYSSVNRREYKWGEYEKAAKFTLPDTKIGRKSGPNQVEFTFNDQTGSVTDHGLADVVPNDDVDNAPEGYSPLSVATENLTDLILLGREVRVAEKFADPTNFGKHHKLSAAGFKHIDDPDLDILPWLLELLDEPLMRPNAMTMSFKVATKLRTNKRMIKAYNGSLGDEGLVPWQFIKDQLEIEHINIGQARINTAKKGKSPVFERAWRDNLAFTYHDPLAGFENKRMTFALTARYKSRVSGNRSVSAGLHGGTEVMVGESVEEQIIAKDCGMLLTDVLTPAP